MINDSFIEKRAGLFSNIKVNIIYSSLGKKLRQVSTTLKTFFFLILLSLTISNNWFILYENCNKIIFILCKCHLHSGMGIRKQRNEHIES